MASLYLLCYKISIIIYIGKVKFKSFNNIYIHLYKTINIVKFYVYINAKSGIFLENAL